MKYISIVFLALLLASCSGKRYVTKWDSFTTEKEPKNVALIMCEAQGKAAGANAANAFQPTKQPSTYSTSCYGYSCTTTEQTNPWENLGNGIAKGLARSEAKNAVIEACMASYGFKKTRVCVKNCN